MRSNQAAGGRPIDPVVDAFDAALEALIALRDDREAIDHTIAGLSHMRRCVGALEAHLSDRLRRLAVSIPDVEQIAQRIDANLTRATLERRVATSATRKATEARDARA